MYRILQDKLEGLKDCLSRHTLDFVRTPSPSLGERLMADKVEGIMRQSRYDIVRRDSAGNVVGVLLGPGGGKTVLLTCHLDTAGTGDVGDAGEEPDRIRGEGAGDCKGGLAAQLCAVDLLRRSLLPLEGNVVVAATVSEELGGSIGVHRLLQDTLPAMKLMPTYAVLGEPTGLGLYYGHDGWMDIDVRVEGPGARMVADRIRDRFRAGPREKVTGVDDPGVVRMHRTFSVDDEISDMLGDVTARAEYAAFGSGFLAVKAKVREEKRNLYTGEARPIQRVVHAWTTDPFCPLVERARQALSAAGCRVAPGKWQLGRQGMGTSGGVFVREYHIPAIGYGPGDERHVHAPGEFVSKRDLAEAAYGTAAIVHSLIGVPVWGWASGDI